MYRSEENDFVSVSMVIAGEEAHLEMERGRGIRSGSVELVSSPR